MELRPRAIAAALVLVLGTGMCTLTSAPPEPLEPEGALAQTARLQSAEVLSALRAGVAAGSEAAATQQRAPVRTSRQAQPAKMAETIHEMPHSPYAPGEHVVALTFDDGPGAATEQILQVLDRERVPATFFMIGAEADRRPELAARVGARWQVGGHTQDHVDLRELGEAARRSQLRAGLHAARVRTGRAVRCVRPPYGSYDAGVVRAIAAEGGVPVLWSIDTRDWQRPPGEVITKRVLAGLAPGAIVLLHDGGGQRQATIDALPGIIRGIHARGYRIVALPGC